MFSSSLSRKSKTFQTAPVTNERKSRRRSAATATKTERDGAQKTTFRFIRGRLRTNSR